MSKTGQELISELRIDLDETTGVGGNWEDSDLLSFLNRSANKVASMLKIQRAGYLEKILLASDSNQTIYDATYSPATELTKVAGDTSITLPENLIELRALIPISQTLRDDGVQFHIVPADHPDFVNARRVSADNSTDGHVYYCAFIGLTQLKIAPPLAEAMTFELHYAAMPNRVTVNDEIDGIPEYAYHAILVYAQYLALLSIKHEDTQLMYSAWVAERKELTELAPRLSDGPTVVAGVFEDEGDEWY